MEETLSISKNSPRILEAKVNFLRAWRIPVYDKKKQQIHPIITSIESKIKSDYSIDYNYLLNNYSSKKVVA